MGNYFIKIKIFRKIQGISQTELARKIEISQSFLSDLENQKFDIKLSMLLKIGEVLKVCPYELTNLCINCPRNSTLFFKYCDGITADSQPHNLYNYLWGDPVNEKTTVYIEPDLKEKVQIRLLKDRDKQSLSSLINEVLEKWLKEQK